MDTVPECGYEGDRREAATAMLAAQSGGDGSHPISLFNLRDALTVGFYTVVLMVGHPSIIYKGHSLMHQPIYIVNTFLPLKEDNLSINGQNDPSQCVHYFECSVF